jgi:ribA/ribD-fused uncharacterized protein
VCDVTQDCRSVSANAASGRLPVTTIFFHKEYEQHGEFSNFYQPASFIDSTMPHVTWKSSEQFFMAAKAAFFGDQQSFSNIMAATTPAQAKHFGAGVRGFDGKKWSAVSEQAMERACYLKFAQNPKLSAMVKATGDAELVEAAPKDSVWGIGYSVHDASANRAQWGQNRLGHVLMRVRDYLTEGSAPPAFANMAQFVSQSMSAASASVLNDPCAHCGQSERWRNPKIGSLSPWCSKTCHDEATNCGVAASVSASASASASARTAVSVSAGAIRAATAASASALHNPCQWCGQRPRYGNSPACCRTCYANGQAAGRW